jgi:hypothetical protein
MATKPKPKIWRHVRYSCIDGRPVWLSPERSYQAMYKAYNRACEHEIQRVRNGKRDLERRRKEILDMLDSIMAGMPILSEMTPKQRAAAKRLRSIADNLPPVYRGFYDHIMEERRRKKADKELRERCRQSQIAWELKKKNENPDYDK